MLSRRINTNITDVHTQNQHQNISTKSREQLTDSHKDKFQVARRNTIKTLLIVGCCFIICWFQNQFAYLIFNCEYNIDFNSTYIHFTILMVFLNCTVNPFIYLFQYRDYQIALKKFIHFRKKEQDRSTVLTTGSIDVSSMLLRRSS